MRSRKSQFAKKSSNAKALTLAVAVAAGLPGCSYPDALNPIEWYRDLTGASKNDDADKAQRNAQNLDAGNKAPYPNLASVPAAPGRAMSTIDREKLQKGLVADRTNAQYSDEELRQGRAVPPLPGDPPAAPAATDAASAAPGTAAAATTPAGPGAGTKRGAPVKGSEQAPRESALTTPQVGGAIPPGDTVHKAPPAPAGVGSPPPQKQQLAAARPGLPTGAVPAGSAAQPAIMRAPRGKGPSVSLQAAEISFSAGGKTLSAEDSQRLTEAAKLFQGASWMRVVGYAKRGAGADALQQELDSFGEAMDRAAAVAQALAKLGVPAGRITVQTAPELVGGGLAAGQAEVFLEY
jgi:outer membrane protein OmpA-like peptidoglycan-associated protein